MTLFKSLLSRTRQSKSTTSQAKQTHEPVVLFQNNRGIKTGDDLLHGADIDKYRSDKDHAVQGVIANILSKKDFLVKGSAIGRGEALILHFYLSLLNFILQKARVNMSMFQIRYNELVSLISSQEKVLRDEFHVQNAAKFTKDLRQAKRSARWIGGLKSRLDRTEKRIKEYTTAINRVIKDDYGGIEPVLKWFHNPIVVLFIICGVMPIEAEMFQVAIDGLQGNDMPMRTIELLSYTFVFVLALSAHFTGYLLARKKVNKTVAIAPSLVALMVLGVILYIRANSATSVLVISLINVAITLLCGFLSYISHQYDDYAVPRRKRAWLQWHVSILEGIINTYKDRPEHLEAIVMDKMNAEEKAYIKKHLGPIQKEFEDCCSLLKTADVYIDNVVAQNRAEYYRDILLYRNSLNSHRQDAELEEINYTNIPIAPLEIEVPRFFPKEEEKPESKNPADNGEPSPDHNGQVYANGHAKAVIHGLVGLMMVAGLSACGGSQEPEPITEPPSNAILYMGDWSVEPDDVVQLPQAEDQISALFNMVDFTAVDEPLTVVREALTVITGHMGETSFPAFDTEYLEAELTPERDLVKSKRRKRQNAFITSINHHIHEEFKAEGLSKSYVIPCLCEGLNRLLMTGADHQKALLISDMIQNGPDLSFYQYGPSLMDHYDDIAAKADQLCAALQDQNLEGMEITAVYLPKPKDDLISKATREFFTRWLGEKGAYVRFQPNLPRSRVISSLANTHNQ